MRISHIVLLSATVVTAGCDFLDSDRPRRGVATEFGGQLAPVDDEGQPLGRKAPPPPSPPSSTPTSDGGIAPPPPPPPPPTSTDVSPPPTPPSGTASDVERTAAVAGAARKRMGLGTGPISTPIAAYFTVRERMVFDIQIPSAMNVYKAQHGHFPKTHEEFMEKIIKANMINLPKLYNSQHRYKYDAEKAAKMKTYDPTDPPLMVEKPR